MARPPLQSPSQDMHRSARGRVLSVSYQELNVLSTDAHSGSEAKPSNKQLFSNSHQLCHPVYKKRPCSYVGLTSPPTLGSRSHPSHLVKDPLLQLPILLINCLTRGPPVQNSESSSGDCNVQLLLRNISWMTFLPCLKAALAFHCKQKTVRAISPTWPCLALDSAPPLACRSSTTETAPISGLLSLQHGCLLLITHISTQVPPPGAPSRARS